MSHLALPLLIGLIIVALGFDFLNGLHDAANSIATVVGTRLLKPVWAVAFAAFFNFAAYFLALRWPELHKVAALLFSGLALALSVAVLAQFKSGEAGFQLVDHRSWISSLGISWTIGAGPLATPFVFRSQGRAACRTW